MIHESFRLQDVNSCCRMPEINLGSVPQKCQKEVNKLKSADEKYPAHAHLVSTGAGVAIRPSRC